MFRIADGRDSFYQWDSNRQIIVTDPTIAEVHFCNKTDDCSLVVEVQAIEIQVGQQIIIQRTADVPNILLQNDFPIRVYAYCGDGYTKIEKIFKVITRSKPSDYAYTETEIKSYEYLDAKLTEIESKGFSEETVKAAVDNHLENNPIQLYFTNDDEGNVIASIDTIPEAEEFTY